MFLDPWISPDSDFHIPFSSFLSNELVIYSTYVFAFVDIKESH